MARDFTSTALLFIVGALGVSAPVHGAETPPIVEHCARLLTFALLEEDPKVIEATLLHAVTVDYPVFFTLNIEKLLFYHLKKALFDVRYFSYRGTVDVSGWEFDQFGRLAPYLRMNSPVAAAAVRQAAEKTWVDLRKLWRKSSFGLDYGRPYVFLEASAAEYAPQVSGLFDTIDANARLKDMMLILLEEISLSADTWFADLRSKKIYNQYGQETGVHYEYKDRAKTIKKFVAHRDRVALPSAQAASWAKPSAPLTEIDLTRLNESFIRASETKRLTDLPAIVRADEELLELVNEFSTGAVKVRDELIGHADWRVLYESAGQWLKLGEKPEASLIKLNVLAALARADSTLLTHARILQSHRITVAYAEKAVWARLRDLQEATLTTHDALADEPLIAAFEREKKNVIARLARLRDDLASLREELDGCSSRADAGAEAIRALREKAPAGRAGATDPEAVRRSLAEIQTALDLDFALNKLVAGKKFNFW